MIVASEIAGGGLSGLIDFVGADAVLKVYAGPVPDRCEDVAGATLARVELRSVWTDHGRTWREANADGTGTASYFRVYDADELRCALQGDIVGELRLDSDEFVAGEDFVVSRFVVDYVDGLPVCRAKGYSIYRRLVREMWRESGGRSPLVRYGSLLRDLKVAASVPASSTAFVLTETGDVWLTEAGVPIQEETA